MKHGSLLDADPTMLGGIVIFVVLVGGIAWIVSARNATERKNRIYTKYGRTDLAERIIRKIVWVGETESQLSDSLGQPVDTDQKVLKTKTKVIWKYAHQGGNRYGLRITVENGAVVGWDEKL